MSHFTNLLAPVRIGHLELKNRIVMPAMSTNYADREGLVTQRLIDYYAERAAGGVGLIIVECGSVCYPEGRFNLNQLGLHDDKFLPGLTRLIDAIHRHDAKVAVQLVHGGKRAGSDITGMQPVSSSSIPIKARNPDWGGGEVPRALELNEIARIAKAFGDAAALVKRAGADAVEVHGAHAFLILEFLSPYSNQRDDQYGGDIEGRGRFACEIVREVRRKVGEAFPILFRISADEEVEGGLVFEDIEMLVKQLQAYGIGAFNVSSGNHDSPEAVIPPAVYPPGFRIHLAEKIKNVTALPVIAGGRVNSAQMAEGVLREGKADLVAIGRGLIADPEYPNKVAGGAEESIRRCIACNQGCIDRYRLFDSQENGLMTCVLNPMVGHEAEYRLERAEIPKRVLVVGAGPAGMQVSLTCRLRGHEVLLVEKESVLGGQIRLASVPPYKEEMKHILEYFESQLRSHGVKIDMNTELTPSLVEKVKPDVIVLATGSIPEVPEIYGGDRSHLLTAWETLKGRECGSRPIVVGGGMVGCETAEFLARKGKQVAIVEKGADIAGDIGPIRRNLLRQRLRDHDVQIYLNGTLETIEEKSVILSGGKEVAADTVIFALGNRSVTDLEAMLAKQKAPVYRVGDCKRPGNLLNAIHTAFHVARIV